MSSHNSCGTFPKTKITLTPTGVPSANCVRGTHAPCHGLHRVERSGGSGTPSCQLPEPGPHYSSQRRVARVRPIPVMKSFIKILAEPELTEGCFVSLTGPLGRRGIAIQSEYDRKHALKTFKKRRLNCLQ